VLLPCTCSRLGLLYILTKISTMNNRFCKELGASTACMALQRPMEIRLFVCLQGSDFGAVLDFKLQVDRSNRGRRIDSM